MKFDLFGINALKEEIRLLRENPPIPPQPPNPPEYAARIADLEIKMAKLWAVLIEVNSRNQEKLTKFGKRFGGAAKDRL